MPTTTLQHEQPADIEAARDKMRERWNTLRQFVRDGLPDPAMHEYHVRRYERARDAYLRITGAL